MPVLLMYVGPANLNLFKLTMADPDLNEKLAALLSRSGLGDKNAFATLYDASTQRP